MNYENDLFRAWQNLLRYLKVSSLFIISTNENLCNQAMIHESEDTDFWLKIAAYAPAMNHQRLSRFTLESVISNNIVDIDIQNGFMPEIPIKLDDLAGINTLRNVCRRSGSSWCI